MDGGYIKIYRKIFDSELWNEKRPRTKMEAWIDILASARFDTEPGQRLVGYKIMTWERGQFPASYRFLAERWGWSTKKVGRFLDYLRVQGMVKVCPEKETGQNVITVCNYDTYNPIEATEETQGKREGNAGVDKTNKGKKDNIIYKSSLADSCRYFIDLFNTLKGRPGSPSRHRLNDKVRRQLTARIKEGYTSEDFRKAIISCKQDPFHVETGLRYLTPEFITRADKLDKYLNRDYSRTDYTPGLPKGL